MPDLHYTSIGTLARQIRDGSLSPVALTQGLLARIDQLNPQLKAFITPLHEEIGRVMGLSRERVRHSEPKRAVAVTFLATS